MSHFTRSSLPAAGLGVHVASISVATARGDGLLTEVRLFHDSEQVPGGLRRCSVAAVCFEAGPTGFGLTRLLWEAGFTYSAKDPDTGGWRDRPDYVDVAVFDGLGETCSQWLAKGRQVAIEGRLR